ncbi:MAG TPA: hypothetical protein VF148_11185 [Acidimicrobiia bacterium]
MKRIALALAALVLIAASPQEVVPELEASGYYIEGGSNASEQVVSDAVFEGRADGGRLYIVVLSDEPPGGAPTFSDSVLDLLDGDGYVLTVAPETVGWAGDGSFWTAEEMNAATDASLTAGSDDEVVQQFVSTITGQSAGGAGEPGTDQGGSETSGGFSFVWVLLIGGAIVAVWVFASRRSRQGQLQKRLKDVKEMAEEKLSAVANDILEMEDEVAVSDNEEVKAHYQRASEMYTKAMEETARATTIREMLDVSEELDLAIWELDCAEALLDGKPKPAKPVPPPDQPVMPPTSVEPEGHGTMPASVPGTVDQFDRRPQRQSSTSNDMATMLLTMLAMRGMGGRGGLGGFGGWGGGGGRMGGGGGRMGGGGGGRMRGGGRRGG